MNLIDDDYVNEIENFVVVIDHYIPNSQRFVAEMSTPIIFDSISLNRNDKIKCPSDMSAFKFFCLYLLVCKFSKKISAPEDLRPISSTIHSVNINQTGLNQVTRTLIANSNRLRQI